MWIKKFRLKNYKPFLDTGEIELGRGINVIVGKNNTGKTALIEALSLNIDNKPHRSRKTLPNIGDVTNSNSEIEFDCAIQLDEMMAVIKRHGGGTCILGTPRPIESEPKTLGGLLSDGFFIAKMTKSYSGFTPRMRPSYFDQIGHSDGAVRCEIKEQAGLVPIQNVPFSEASTNDIGVALSAIFARQIYRFKAERLNVAIAKFAENRQLNSDAGNLPAVLNCLHANPELFEKYNILVKRIFPEIEKVTVRPKGSDMVEVLLWTDRHAMSREDLAKPLAQSGTGIGQILAMLYVLVTTNYPTTILIDEPNSFLHPGAVRSLMSILQEYDQHQFIISTHSPAVIRLANPSAVLLLQHSEGLSTIQCIDKKSTEDIRNCLIELGAGLSEVFGADQVLWVEGPTEELCFPRILHAFNRKQPSNTAIVGVRSTGDFDKRTIRSAFEIYEKLSRNTALIPPAVGYLLDREKRTEEEAAAFTAKHGKKIQLLPRRCYENYLLNPQAISYVLNKTETFKENNIDPQRIESWIEGNSDQFNASVARDKDLAGWVCTVDSAKLLTTLFQELSDGKELYRKVIHSVEITDWLLENANAEMEELADTISGILDA